MKQQILNSLEELIERQTDLNYQLQDLRNQLEELDCSQEDIPRTLHWPSQYIPLTWSVNWDNAPSHLNRSQMLLEMRRVFGKYYIASERKLGFRYVNSNASLEIQFQVIDGPGGTLAFVYQPAEGTDMSACGGQCGNYYFDNQESFSIIDFHNVFLHETGHAIGIGHGPSNSIMAPSYRMGALNRYELDSWTITQTKEKYVY